MSWFKFSASFQTLNTGQFTLPINSVDNTRLPCYTPLPTQHHSFFRNLPPYSLSISINNSPTREYTFISMMDQTTWLWTPISDQDILSPYNINTVSSGQAIRGLFYSIQYQILQTIIIRIVLQTARRLTTEMLGGKGSNDTIRFKPFTVSYFHFSPRADMKADEWVTRLIDDKWVVNLSCPND